MHAVAHRARAAKVCAVRRDPPRGVGGGESQAPRHLAPLNLRRRRSRLGEEPDRRVRVLGHATQSLRRLGCDLRQGGFHLVNGRHPTKRLATPPAVSGGVAVSAGVRVDVLDGQQV